MRSWQTTYMIFDNQAKIWGGSIVGLGPSFLGYLRLKYCLDALRCTQGNILDVGCGGGGFAASVKTYRPDLNIYAIDVNKRAVFSASKKFPEVHFKTASVYTLPYLKQYFDAVIGEDVLEHLDDPQKALKEIHRVLKPRGVFHVFVPLEGEWYTLHNLLYKFGWKAKERLAGHVTQFKIQNLKLKIEKFGFKVLSVKYSVHLFGQIIDVGYFSFLSLFKQYLNIGLEEKLESWPSVLRLAKNLLTVAVNYESILFQKIPGAGVHITVVKK